MTRIVLVAATLLVAMPLHAQHCRKGIPCGNSCISASKTCRVGRGTAWGGPSSTSEPARPRSTRTEPSAPSLNLRSTGRGGYAVADTNAPYLGWPYVGMYYARTCSYLPYIPRDSLTRWFRTPDDAEKAGFKRSPLPGC